MCIGRPFRRVDSAGAVEWYLRRRGLLLKTASIASIAGLLGYLKNCLRTESIREVMR